MPYPSNYGINPTARSVESGDIDWPLLAPDGSTAAPSYSWEDDPDTGFYRSSITPGIHWSVGGNTNGRLVEGGLTLYDTSGNTSFGAGTSGMFSKAGNVYQLQTTTDGTFAWNDVRLVSDASLGWNPDSNPLTAADLKLTRASAGVLSLSTGSQMLFPDGSAGSPSISFASETADGMYRSASYLDFKSTEGIRFTATQSVWFNPGAGTGMYIQIADVNKYQFTADYFIPFGDAIDLGYNTARWRDTSTGGLLVSSVAKTTAYTVAAGDSVIECDASSAAFTVTLPAAASHDGRVIYIKKTDSSANAVTIDGNGAETIDGATTVDVLLQYECLQLVCNGTGWSVV